MCLFVCTVDFKHERNFIHFHSHCLPLRTIHFFVRFFSLSLGLDECPLKINKKQQKTYNETIREKKEDSLFLSVANVKRFVALFNCVYTIRCDSVADRSYWHTNQYIAYKFQSFVLFITRSVHCFSVTTWSSTAKIKRDETADDSTICDCALAVAWFLFFFYFISTYSLKFSCLFFSDGKPIV